MNGAIDQRNVAIHYSSIPIRKRKKRVSAYSVQHVEVTVAFDNSLLCVYSSTMIIKQVLAC